MKALNIAGKISGDTVIQVGVESAQPRRAEDRRKKHEQAGERISSLRHDPGAYSI
jgi:hypothetical protein